MMDELKKMMALFEAWVIDNNVDLDIEHKDEDEFGVEYYLDFDTKKACFVFAGGYATAAMLYEQNNTQTTPTKR